MSGIGDGVWASVPGLIHKCRSGGASDRGYRGFWRSGGAAACASLLPSLGRRKRLLSSVLRSPFSVFWVRG